MPHVCPECGAGYWLSPKWEHGANCGECLMEKVKIVQLIPEVMYASEINEDVLEPV